MSTPEGKRLRKKNERSFSQFSFPDNIGSHAIVLIFKKYSFAQRRVQTAVGESFPSSSIMLPLPEQLLDNASLRVRGEELGAIGANVATASGGLRDTLQGGGDVVESLMRNLGVTDWKSAGNLAGQVGASMAKEALSKVRPGAQKGLEAGVGMTFNPYQALTFGGVELKAFTMDWTLAPTTRSEAERLKKIIKQIRYHVHPEYKNMTSTNAAASAASSRAFLEYPDMVDIKILGSNDDAIIQFKTCMVSQFQVNYAGAGELAFLEGGDPAVVKLSMTLTESEIWTKEDYNTEDATANNKANAAIFT